MAERERIERECGWREREEEEREGRGIIIKGVLCYSKCCGFTTTDYTVRHRGGSLV
jgi:hypothetical protein